VQRDPFCGSLVLPLRAISGCSIYKEAGGMRGYVRGENDDYSNEGEIQVVMGSFYALIPNCEVS
jgi:hypothetical protein